MDLGTDIIGTEGAVQNILRYVFGIQYNFVIPNLKHLDRHEEFKEQ